MKRKTKKQKLPRYKRYIRLWCWKLSKGLKLQDKVGSINDWAIRNPKIFFRTTVGILSFVAFTTIVSLVFSYYQRSQVSQSANDAEQEEVKPIGDPMVMENISRFRQIDNNKKAIRQETKALTDKGLVIKAELDSLLALPEKTHDDSIRIVTEYNSLKSIVEFLNRSSK